MEIKTVEEKMIQALSKPNDEKLVQEYIGDYVAVLDELKITADTANLAVNGVDLDQGVNFLDAFASLEKKAIQTAWKTIHECEAFKNNENRKALKLACAFAASAFGGDPNTAFVVGNILTAVVALIKEPTKEDFEIIREYIFEIITKETKLPEWNDIRMTPENALLFCEIISKSIQYIDEKEKEETIPVAGKIGKWNASIKMQAEEAKELKDREKNKPLKKSEELRKLVDHFKGLEDELDRSIYECAKLATDKKKLQEEICELEDQKRKLSSKISELEKEIEDLNSKVNKANQEVDERKKLNDAQVQYREDAQASLLQDIARALKAEYGDYAETKDSPMDIMLGEIYREKLKQIFKILEQKGIKVEA